MVTTMVTLAVTAVLVLLLETFSGWALGLGLGIATSILDPSTFSFVLDNGAGGGLLNILPSLGSGFGLFDIFKVIGWVILVANCLFALIGSIINPLIGEKATTPGETVFSGISSALLMVLTFGIGSTRGLIYYFGTVMDKLLNIATTGMLGANGKLKQTADALLTTIKGSLHSSTNVWNNLSGIFSGDFSGASIYVFIISIAICIGIINAAITHIERYLSLALYITVGPTAIGFNSSPATRDTTKQWFIGLLTQTLAIILSILCWRLLFAQLVKPWTVFNTITSLAILTMISKSEQIFNMIGLRTMPNSDTARSFLGAIATTGALATTALHLTKSGIEGVKGLRQEQLQKEIADNQLYNGIKNAKNQSDIDIAADKYRASHPGSLFASNDKIAKKYEEMKAKNSSSEAALSEQSKLDYENALFSARTYGDFEKIPQQRRDMNQNLNNVKAQSDNPNDENSKKSLVYNAMPEKDNVIFNEEGADKTYTPLGTYSLHNFNNAYNAERSAASGDVSAQNAIDKKYQTLGKEIFGNEYRHPNIAKCTTNASEYASPTVGNEFSMQIESSNNANEMIGSQVQAVNNVMSENSTQDSIEAGYVEEAFGLNAWGLTDSGMISGQISTQDDYVGYSGISLLTNEDGGQQLYTFLPSDYAISEGTTISPTIETMNAAKYELDARNATQIGENVMAVPLKPIDFEDTNGKELDSTPLRAQAVLHETFTQLAANRNKNKHVYYGSQE